MKLKEQLPNGIITPNGHLLGGQPDERLLSELQSAGFSRVLDMRHANETELDEQQLVESLGLEYIRMPMTLLADLDDAYLAKYEEIWKGPPALIHCRSGNRVGAACAVLHYRKNQNKEQAVAYGLACGLTKLLDDVLGELT